MGKAMDLIYLWTIELQFELQILSFFSGFFFLNAIIYLARKKIGPSASSSL